MAERRKPNVAAPARPRSTLVLDNGAWTLKAGVVSGDCDGDAIASNNDDEQQQQQQQPRVIPNCIARDRSRKIYVGSEVDKCRDCSEMQFRRPVEKGFIVNWEAQKEIWDRELFDQREGSMRCGDPSEMRLILTEQACALPALQANCDQIVFEEYGFSSYYRGMGSTFNAYHDLQSIFRTNKDVSTAANVPSEIVMVVDTGYSYTTVTPLLRGRPLHSAIRRIDVGGKLLTNYMARLISLRHFDVRNEPCIVNDIKEAGCYVSLDFRGDLERTWKGTRGEKRGGYLSGAGIVKDYVLPDFHTRNKGVLRDYDPERHTKGRKLAAAAAGETEEDVLTLRNERFAVPELIFSPSDMGMRQPGLAEAIMQSLRELPLGLWPALLANIVVVGGNSLFEGFVQRLQRELMALVPDDCVVRVARPGDPIAHTWFGAANMARHGDVERVAVTRAEYEENGQAWVARRFAAGLQRV